MIKHDGSRVDNLVGNAVHFLGQMDVLVGHAFGGVCGQGDLDLVVDVEPFGMMVVLQVMCVRRYPVYCGRTFSATWPTLVMN